MKTRWIVTVAAAAVLAFGALAWAGSGPADPDDDFDGSSDAPGHSVWMSQRHPGGMLGMRRMGLMGRRAGLMARRQEILEDLDLSKDQKKEIAEIRDEQQRRAIDKRAEIQIAALDLRKLMKANRPDRDAIEHQIDVIARLRADLRKSQVEALFDMRDVLTPEQREEFRDRWLGVESD